VFQIGRQQMIEGWEKGLLDMCVGEKRKLVVPSDMVCSNTLHGHNIDPSPYSHHLSHFVILITTKAYGNVGGFGSESLNKIKPGATLVYKVELLNILDEEAAAPYMVWGL
jgi:FKBP-type peptidyl-prolyl cis-trans isomerase